MEYINVQVHELSLSTLSECVMVPEMIHCVSTCAKCVSACIHVTYNNSKLYLFVLCFQMKPYSILLDVVCMHGTMQYSMDIMEATCLLPSPQWY